MARQPVFFDELAEYDHRRKLAPASVVDVGQGVVARDGSNRVQQPGGVRVRVLLARDMGFAGRCTMLFAGLSLCILFYQPQGALAPSSELGSLMYFALPPLLKSRLSTVKRYK